MDKKSTIYVIGHTGMVGSAILDCLYMKGYKNILKRSNDELDLKNQEKVDCFFNQYRPEYVFIVSPGYGEHQSTPEGLAEFICGNVLMQMNVIKSAVKYGVKRLMILGDTDESDEPFDEALSLSKLCAKRLCEYLNKQSGTNYICVVPSCLYGPKLNYSDNRHVLPYLIKKIHEAKAKKLDKVMINYSGEPLGEYMYVYDFADACVYLMDNYQGSGTVNLGTGKETSIQELIKIISDTIGYNGKVAIYSNKNIDIFPKHRDVSSLTGIGWRYYTDITDGLILTYDDYVYKYAREQY